MNKQTYVAMPENVRVKYNEWLEAGIRFIEAQSILEAAKEGVKELEANYESCRVKCLNGRSQFDDLVEATYNKEYTRRVGKPE